MPEKAEHASGDVSLIGGWARRCFAALHEDRFDLRHREEADNGGLDIEATWKRLSGAWFALHEECDPNAWLALHWASVGGGDWSMRLATELRRRSRGAREVALAIALERLREFCEVERPLIEVAESYRIARSSLEQLVGALADIDPSMGAGLVEYAYFALERKIDAFEWSTARFPSVARVIRKGRGRPPSSLRDELVAVLQDGGYRLPEIAELVVDPGGADGALERVYQATRTSRSSKSEVEAT